MKSFVFPTVLGGLLLFFWQFLSFAAINLHGQAQEYTPLDRNILAHMVDALVPFAMVGLLGHAFLRQRP